MTKQEFCPLCHDPRHFYVDEARVCVQCGRRFVFRAAEQKFWYETLKFHFDSVAIRCLACRRRQRTRRALGNQLAAAKRALRDDPGNATHLLDLAEATVRYRRQTGEGDLAEAIAAARRAGALWPAAREALFWQAAAHAAAGHARRAAPLFRRFVREAAHIKRCRGLVREARLHLAEAGD